VVPTRTMIAAVPGPFSRLPSDSAGNLIGLYYPVLGRFQHVASGLVSGEQGSQASGERHSAGLQTEQQTDSAVQQHNLDGPARDGNLNILLFNRLNISSVGILFWWHILQDRFQLPI